MVPLPAAIGHRFVKEYYTLLSKNPAELHKFYKAASVFSHGREGAGAVSSAVGPEAIRGEIRASVGSFNGYACRAEISGIESQESHHGGVLVLVTGHLSFTAASPHGAERRRFSQTVFLARQTDPDDGYFVLNDILRFTAGETLPARLPQQVPGHQAPSRLPPKQPPVEAAPAVYQVPEEKEVETQRPRTGRHRVEEHIAQYDREEEEEEQYNGAGHEETHAAAVEDALDHFEESKPDEPKTWASMAEKLRQGPGKLAPPARSKGLPAPTPKTGMPVLPPPSSVLKAEAAPPARVITGLPPPRQPGQHAEPAPSPEHVNGANGNAASASSPGTVRLWLSRIPTDRAVPNEELVECINQAFAEDGANHGGALQVDRTDLSKENAYLVVSSSEAAEAVVRLSKGRKLQLGGKGIKVDYDRKAADVSSRPPAGKGGENGGTKWAGKGAARYENGNATNGSDWAEGDKEASLPRKGAKGGKGGKGNAERGSVGQGDGADDEATGGSKGRRGGGKGFSGGWKGSKGD